MGDREEKDRNQAIDSVNRTLEHIYSTLEGKTLNAQNLAAAISEFCSYISETDLIKDCEELLEGVKRGSSFAEGMLDMTDEEVEQVLPDKICKELAVMSADQQHQYLLLLYQMLGEKAGRRISQKEAICAANASNQILLEKVIQLVKVVQVDITAETAEVVQESMEQLQENQIGSLMQNYTEEENTWILAAAVYAQAQETQLEKIPAQIIGQNIGMSAVSMKSFRNSMLSEVIPAAVSALSVIAVCGLAIFCVHAVASSALFLTASTWLQQYVNLSILRCGLIYGMAVAAPKAVNLVDTIGDKMYMATAALTCRWMRDEVHAEFEQNFIPVDQEQIFLEQNEKHAVIEEKKVVFQQYSENVQTVNILQEGLEAEGQLQLEESEEFF